MNWQGNQGINQAMHTDHTIDDAQRYVKENYTKNKTYTIRRLEPGFRALDIKTGMLKPEKIHASISQEEALNQFIDIFKLQQNAYLSGSKQITASIGYSWHVAEDSAREHAIFYYEDRGMGQDSITIAAKTTAELDKMREVLIQSGLVPDPAEIKAKRAATATKRNDMLEKKGIKIGTRITSAEDGKVWFSGIVTNIGKTGIVEITIDQSNMQTLSVGDKHKMKPGNISKSMISNS